MVVFQNSFKILASQRGRADHTYLSQSAHLSHTRTQVCGDCYDSGSPEDESRLLWYSDFSFMVTSWIRYLRHWWQFSAVWSVCLWSILYSLDCCFHYKNISLVCPDLNLFCLPWSHFLPPCDFPCVTLHFYNSPCVPEVPVDFNWLIQFAFMVQHCVSLLEKHTHTHPWQH